jgi:hypothetical protein
MGFSSRQLSQDSPLACWRNIPAVVEAVLAARAIVVVKMKWVVMECAYHVLGAGWWW